MIKHYKVLKIEKKDDMLNIWVKMKGKYLKYAEMFDRQFKDENISYLGTSIDESGKYIILKFVLRSEEDIINYIITPTPEHKKFGKELYKKIKRMVR